METHSGRKVYPLAMTADMISLRDITTSLSRINRYYGHTFLPVSVLEHSWLVAKVVKQRGAPPEVVLGALLHDAKEAYIGDIATPIKYALAEAMGNKFGSAYSEDFLYVLREIEENIDAAICAAVGCIDLEDMYHEMVKQADADVLAFEASKVVHSKGVEWKFSRPIQELPAATIYDHGPIGHWTGHQLINRVEAMYDRLVEEIRGQAGSTEIGATNA